MHHDEAAASVVEDALLEAGHDVLRGGTVVTVFRGGRGLKGRHTQFYFEDGQIVVTREDGPREVENLLRETGLRSVVKVRGALYNVHDLDVWGNEDDGFEINEFYPSRGKVEIPTRAKDADIVHALKKGGYLKATVKPSDVAIEDAGDGQRQIQVDDAKTGEPLLILMSPELP